MQPNYHCGCCSKRLALSSIPCHSQVARTCYTLLLSIVSRLLPGLSARKTARNFIFKFFHNHTRGPKMKMGATQNLEEENKINDDGSMAFFPWSGTRGLKALDTKDARNKRETNGVEVTLDRYEDVSFSFSSNRLMPTPTCSNCLFGT